MDANQITKVAQERESIERWPCTLLFDMSEAGDGSNVINILRCVSDDAFPSSAAMRTFPSRYTSKEGMEQLRHDLHQAAQRSGYQICVVKSIIKDGSIKKKITFGCQ
jgi:hypothetical protein